MTPFSHFHYHFPQKLSTNAPQQLCWQGSLRKVPLIPHWRASLQCLPSSSSAIESALCYGRTLLCKEMESTNKSKEINLYIYIETYDGMKGKKCDKKRVLMDKFSVEKVCMYVCMFVCKEVNKEVCMYACMSV